MSAEKKTSVETASDSPVAHQRLVRLTPAQRNALEEMADGSILHVSWTGGRGLITKPNGMTIRVQRRMAISLVNSGRVTKLEYDGRLRDSYSRQPNDALCDGGPQSVESK